MTGRAGMARLALVLAMAVVFSGCPGGQRGLPGAPTAYKKCRVCHGAPGEGGTRHAPDLAESRMTPEQFRTQVAKGSKWDGKPPKIPAYKYKKMPAQIGVSDADVERIYNFVSNIRDGARN